MIKRSEAAERDTWKLEDMLASDEAWEELYTEAAGELTVYEEFKGRLAESADILCRCLTFDDRSSQKMELLYVYAKMRLDQDASEQKYQDFFARAQSLSFQAAQASFFMAPEILAMPQELLEEYQRSDPGISRFRRSLEILTAKREHTLSEEMENMLAASYEATQGASQIFGMFNNADIRFPVIMDADGKNVQITHGNYIALLENQDRRVRRDAFEGMYSVYRQFSNTLAAAFASNVKQAIFYAMARKYASSREYMLAENEVPVQVYDNLVSAVREALPKMHRYVSLRKRMLKVDELHMYDLYVPLVASYDRKYTFKEAKDLVKEGLAPLGEEYGQILQEGFDHRWIDVYENEGKRSGAYSWGVYGCHPYVLMNFHGTLNDVFTLAHEMGHSIHSWYSDHNQTYTDAGYKIFVAEVASTCNEALLIRHLIAESKNREEKAYLINHFLETFRGTLYRQTMFAEFERETHAMAERGESLTAQGLCEYYHRLNADYFGPDMTVDASIDYEWARIPHFYTPFYVYQYATGFSAAVAISSRILRGEPGALEGYRRFLSGGCSQKPVELLKLCDIDMSTPEPVREALAFFDELLDEFEDILPSQGRTVR